jgi:hypothetical protein
MDNCGGGGNNQGRGPPGGRGGSRWDGGSNGGRHAFEEGGPSGTTGQEGYGEGHGNNTNVFGDGDSGQVLLAPTLMGAGTEITRYATSILVAMAIVILGEIMLDTIIEDSTMATIMAGMMLI